MIPTKLVITPQSFDLGFAVVGLRLANYVLRMGIEEIGWLDIFP